MSVRVEQDIIYLEGDCPIEDAEPLLVALLEGPDSRIDLGSLTRAHMAVAQILAAASHGFIGSPAQGFVGDMLLPALTYLSIAEQKGADGSCSRTGQPIIRNEKDAES